jgi:geranylgeranyl diphosphate synthase, type II
VKAEQQAKRSLIDARLRQIAAEGAIPAPLRPPLEAALTSSGKRIRGLLLMFAAEAFGCRGDRVVDAAAAIEMVHSSSLILDDLPSMDDAKVRRGEPALHLRFGEDLAILAAVALLNQAYGLFSANHQSLAPRRWSSDRLMQRVVEAVGWDGSVGGEAVDLHHEGERLDFTTLEFIHSRKTGALFVSSAAVGAMLANASEANVRAVELFAKNLGLAFQISDDILDATATEQQLGKDVGKDAERFTFVRLAGIEGARQLNGELIDTALLALEPLGRAASPLRELAGALRDRVS